MALLKTPVMKLKMDEIKRSLAIELTGLQKGQMPDGLETEIHCSKLTSRQDMMRTAQQELWLVASPQPWLIQA